MAKGKKSSGAYPSNMGMDDYQGESDHNTLSRATDIQKDPARMKGVMQHQIKAVKQVRGVHDSVVESGVKKSPEYKKLMGSLKKRGL